MAGFRTLEVKSSAAGLVDLGDLAAKLDARTAVFMITNPNTLGLFDRQIGQIAEMVHAAGGLVYLDGANMNAILGIARPGDFGADLMHFNPHKTFSGPHGGGGPGRADRGCRQAAPYRRRWSRNGATAYTLDFDRPKSIGRVRAFREHGGPRADLLLPRTQRGGIARVAENAVLNANYLLSRVKIASRSRTRPLHARVVASAQRLVERGVTAMDVAKRLLDYGFHAPTVYFPLIVREALMIEPTRRRPGDLDTSPRRCSGRRKTPACCTTPHTTAVCRPDEVHAARQPILK